MHLFDRSALLPPAVAKAMHRLAEMGPDAVIAWRKEAIARYTKRAEQLAQEERKLRASLNPRVESIVAEKRILLFKEMLEEINYDDIAVVYL